MRPGRSTARAVDQHVLGLAAVGAAVHAQRAADRARNAAHERQPGDAGLLRRARDLHVRHRRAGPDARAIDLDLVEAAAEPHHHARHAAVAHDQVGAEADHDDRNVGGDAAEEIGEVVLVLRHEQHLRRPADAEPGQLGERLVRQQPAAQLGARGFQIGVMSGKVITRTASAPWPSAPERCRQAHLSAFNSPRARRPIA